MHIGYEEFCKKFNLLPMPNPAQLRTLHVVWRFSLPLSAAKLWPYVADTASFNRKLGLAPRQEKEVDGKKVVTTTMLGFKQEWIEEPWTWFRGKSIQSIRHYSKGIAKEVQSNFILDPTDRGVDFYVNFSWMPANAFSYHFLRLTMPLLKKNFEKVFKQIVEYTQQNSVAPDALKLLNDPSTNVNLAELEKANVALKNQNLSAAAVDGLCEFIKTGDDGDLYRIKVLKLAQKLQVPKKDLLKTCMEAVNYGLLNLSWDVICPHCRGARVAAQNLGDIPATSECLVCEVDFETDNLESIEVVFHVQPNYRKVNEVLFCAAEPAKKDHIQIKQQVQPEQVLRFTQGFKEGRHRIRLTKPSANFYFEVRNDRSNSKLQWDMSSETVPVFCGPQINFELKNHESHERSLCIEQLWWQDDSLHPADIFAMPEYRHLFSRESLNTDVKVSMGSQVIMFTDIVNSTVFYNEKGDAAAFNEVRDHFTEVFEAMTKSEGNVVKTIGDSIMGCFQSADKAIESAIEIQRLFHRNRSDTTIRLRISLHYGPVIAVHLLQGIDFFGTTVNKAAKLQACANGGEVACSNEFVQMLDQRWLEQFVPYASQRRSNYLFKEVPLEAHVFDLYKLNEAEAPNAAKNAA